MLAYQLSSFLLYVYLYAKLLHMPAGNSIISISLQTCAKFYLGMLYAGFVCQQQHVKFCDLEDVSYLRLSIYYCKQVALSSYMSLHIPICIPTTVL
jgi:hypothetical protein